MAGIEFQVRIENDLCTADRLAEGESVIYGGLVAQVTEAEYVDVDGEQMVQVFMKYHGYAVSQQTPPRQERVIVPPGHIFRTLRFVVDR